MEISNRVSAEEALKASTQILDGEVNVKEVAEILEELCYPAILRSTRIGLTQAQVSFASFDIYTLRKVMGILQKDGFWVTFDTTGRYHHSAYLKIDWSIPANVK